MNLRYLHVSLDINEGLPISNKSREGLRTSHDLEKWKTSIFPCSNMRPKFSKREEIML